MAEELDIECGIEQLPDEILGLIFSFTTQNDLHCLARVSHRWEFLIREHISLSSKIVIPKHILLTQAFIDHLSTFNPRSIGLWTHRDDVNDETILQMFINHECLFPDLQSLDLKWCQSVADSTLRILALSLCRFTELCLKECKHVSNRGMECLATMTSLRKLDLEGCYGINDGAVQHLSALPHLQNLNLKLTQACGDSLRDLHHLTRLNFSSRYQTYLCPDFHSSNPLQNITVLTTLRCLLLCSTTLDFGLHTLSNLDHLDISDSRLSMDAIASFKHLVCLKHLIMPRCSYFSDKHLRELTTLSNLISLDINSTHITDEGVKHLKFMPHLLNLDLSRCDITDQSLQMLSCLSKLQELRLSQCKFLTDEGVIAHLSVLTQLRQLHLKSAFLTTLSLIALTTLRQLNVLNASKWVVNDGAANVFSCFTNLQELNLSHCQITDQIFPSFTSLAALRLLNLSGCQQVSDEGLMKLTKMESLSFLLLYNCGQVTYDIPEKLPGITSVLR